MMTVHLFLMAVAWIAINQTASTPWAPNARCQLNRANPTGLHPGAYAALQNLALTHRITQGMNASSDRGNVHQADTIIDGKPYTGAVDISVRCLSESQVRTLLGQLANAGFAAWYRNPGHDNWMGPRHIHAVWAGSRLKPVLQQQVESWLKGGNGLFSRDQPYRFWQPTPDAKGKVQALYSASN